MAKLDGQGQIIDHQFSCSQSTQKAALCRL